MSLSKPSVPHPWTFFRAGGFDQVRLTTADDLRALATLDPKLWVALACPTTGLEFDERTLALLDADHDGRIRVPEMLEAVRWVCACLTDPAAITAGSATLPLASISSETAEGKAVLAAARSILTNLGKAGATEISVEDTTDTTKIFAQTTFNGDGLVPVDAASDEPTRQALADILATLGGGTDRSGKPGVTEEKSKQFFADVDALAAWAKRAADDATLLPAGPATAEASAAWQAVRAKVEDYFARCALASFDARAAAALNREEAAFLALAAKDLTMSAAEIAALPMARVEAGRALPLGEGTNPAWSAALQTFAKQAVKPLVGERASLTHAEWTSLCARLEPYVRWQADRPATPVASLAEDRIRALAKGSARQDVQRLIDQDKAVEAEANGITSVEKLVRFHRDLFRLLNNFVAFTNFYRPGDKAIFQAGTLYLDQRSFELCIRVEDAAKHAALATLARTYLVYCDITRKSTNEKRSIVAAVTNGDATNLMAGRNGVFYDRQGRDWDATVTKLVDHPISVRQAFWAPYRKVARLVESQLEKFAAAKDKEVHDSAAGKVDGAAKQLDNAKPADAPKPAFDVAKFAGIFAAIGLAIGAIGGALGALVTALAGLAWWQLPLAVVGAMLAVSGPSMLMAWLKLRHRNLGPLLDANGWAVNSQALINIPFGESLTRLAKLPPGARRNLTDPFAESKRGRWLLVAALFATAALIAAWRLGLVARLLH